MKPRLTAWVALIAPMSILATVNPLKVNQIGYLTDDIKVAVYMADEPIDGTAYLKPADGSAVVTADSVVTCQPWSPKAHSYRIYFTSVSAPDQYTLYTSRDGRLTASAPVYIGDDAYSRYRLNELPLVYMRQQRCGYNPAHRDSCHTHDGRLVLSGDSDSVHVDVRGGWHDASDYLQYVTTSATATYQMLFAYAQNPGIWADEYNAAGLPGANGTADILDEARWGLEWLQRMQPDADTLFLNQIADDRDHRYGGVPAGDNVDYGWGAGAERPVYPCIGRPCGLGKYRNKSTGLASSVGKFASAFALGAQIFADIDSAFAADLAQRSATAYDVARRNPGVCQTACMASPYYYEEDNWTDDMQLAATARFALTELDSLMTQAVDYGRCEPVTPWMGADSAHHYQWYPFINLGQYELARRGNDEALRNMRTGISRVAERGAGNAFRYGIPFIWCSNNLAVAFATQALLYRQLTGDQRWREAETAARDWLFGVNPWAQMMVILPEEMGASPGDPHSAMSTLTLPDGTPGRDHLLGGLVDGPISAAKYNSLWGVHLRRGTDPFADVQNAHVVYHDDGADYSTNEPTMDGTASLTILLGQLARPRK